MVHEACKRLDKQVIGCSEQFMQALEQIDGIVSVVILVRLAAFIFVDRF